MAATKRADVIGRVNKTLAKHYKPIKPVERPVLEQLLYAACLEDSRQEMADECFARLQESYFDWNEIRVTAIRELSEVLRGLTDPVRAATHVKQTLHSVFEAIYDFDLEATKKQNLGVALKQLDEYKGTTPFAVSYVAQTCYAGHSIPVSDRGFQLMYILGVINEKERESNSVPGLERAIPKNKGVEFGSLLQQFAADFAASPFNTTVRSIVLDIDPDAKERLPKRGGGRKAAPPKKAPKKAAKKATKKKAAPAPAASAPPKKKKAVKKKAVVKKKAAKKKATAAAPKKKKKAAKSGGSITKKANRGGKKSATKQLARRKPR